LTLFWLTATIRTGGEVFGRAAVRPYSSDSRRPNGRPRRSRGCGSCRSRTSRRFSLRTVRHTSCRLRDSGTTPGKPRTFRTSRSRHNVRPTSRTLPRRVALSWRRFSRACGTIVRYDDLLQRKRRKIGRRRLSLDNIIIYYFFLRTRYRPAIYFFIMSLRTRSQMTAVAYTTRTYALTDGAPTTAAVQHTAVPSPTSESDTRCAEPPPTSARRSSPTGRRRWVGRTCRRCHRVNIIL